MKSAFLLLTITAAFIFTGCSTIYQTEQTPDDLYYSPSKERTIEKEVTATNNNRDARYEEYISSSDDRYLRMKVANRNRWDALDDYSYWNDSRFDFYGYNSYNNFYGYNYYNNFGFYPGLSFGYNNFYGNGYYPSYGWGNGFNNSYYGYYGGYYNPYYSIAYYKNINAPRGYTSGSNLSSYRNNNYNNNNYNLPPSALPRRDNSNSFSNLIRRVIVPSSGSSSNTPSTTVDRPARTFSPSTTPTPNTGGSSGGYGSSGSSSSAPRKPRG